MIQLHFDHSFIASFQIWEAAFHYITVKTATRTAVIIDEFPYIVQENPTINVDFQFYRLKA